MTGPRNPLKALGIGAAALLAVLLVTPAVWARLDHWGQTQRNLVWARLEQAVGQKLEYDRISPAVLDTLEFRNVRVLADDGTPVIRAGSVRFSWDWAMVFQGRFDQIFRKIQVVNGTVNLDSSRDKDLLARCESLLKPGAPVQFAVEGFNLSGRWTDGTRTLSLDRGFFLLSPDGTHWGLRYRGALAWDDRSEGSRYAKLLVRGDLRTDSTFSNLNLRLEVSQAQTSWFDLEPLTLQVAVDPRSVSITKVADRIPLDLRANLDRASGLWNFSGAAEGFQPSTLVHWKQNPLWVGLSQGSVTGKFTYQWAGDLTFRGTVAWPAGALPAPFDREPAQARGEVHTSRGIFQFQDFRWDSRSLALGFDGSLDPETLVPDGTLVLERWVLPDTGLARGTVRLRSEGKRIVLAGEGWHWNELGSAAPIGWLEKEDRTWRFRLDGPLDGTEGGTVGLGGSLDPSHGTGLLEVSFLDIPLGQFRDEFHRHLPSINLPTEAWNLTASLRGTVGWTPGQVTVSGSTFEFHDPSDPNRLGRGTFAWENGRLSVGLDPVRWDQFSAGFRFNADFHPEGPVDASLEGHFWDRPVSLVGRWDPSLQTLVFSGNPGIRGSVRQTDPDTWSAQMALEPLELVPGMSLGFHGTATVTPASWNLDLVNVTLTGQYPWDKSKYTIQGELKAEPGTLRLETLSVTDSKGTLAGQAASTWSQDFSQPWTGTLDLGTVGTNRETLSASWSGTAWDRWHIGFKAGGIDLSRLGPVLVKGIQGRLALACTSDWAGGTVDWTAQAALSESRWGDSPLGFRALLSGTGRHLSVRNLNLSVNPFHVTDGALDLDADSRTWKSSLAVGLRLGTGDWESRLESTGDWEPGSQVVGGRFTVETTDNSWFQKKLPDWKVLGSWDKNRWEASLGEGSLTAGGLADGSFRIRTKAPFPIGGEADGSWNDGRISLSVRKFQTDLSLVKDFISSKPFSVLSGQVEGDFTVGGNLSDPEADGRLMFHNLRMASVFVRQPLGPVEVPMVLSGHQLRIDPVNLGPHGQVWMVSAQARLDHLLPEEYQVTVQTDALSVIPATFEGVGLSAQGGVTGFLTLKGTPMAVSLGGRLVCQDTQITLKESHPEPGPGTPLGFNADMTLVTGRKVEFLWPNESLPLIRAVTATDQTMVIRTNDVSATWSVTGKLALKTGEINYLNQTFVIKEGLLGFQESQLRFDPHLSVRAELKVPEPTGTVTVNLHADGTLATFSPRFDATPYMSANDLQQLLGITLALPSDYSKSTNINTALSVASDVGTSFLLSPFEQLVRRNFQLDLFTVRTEILKRSLLNRNGPSEASDYLDNTRLFFGKYIGDDLFLQGTLAFSPDPIIVTQGSPQMVVEPEFQMEFQTPFFLMNWTLQPQHPETLFVTDNTVTFRWNWSY